VLKDRDIDLVIGIRGDYTWMVNGLTVEPIPAQVRNMNMRVTATSDSSILALASGIPITGLRVRNEGAFPFDTVLEWNVGRRYSGQVVSIYAYSGGQLTYVDASIANDQGQVVYNLGNAVADRYVLTTEAPQAALPTGSGDVAPPPVGPGPDMIVPGGTVSANVLVLNESTPANAEGVRPFIMRNVGDGFQIGLISLRVFADFIGATPAWDGETSTATVTGIDANGNPVVVSLVSGQTQITVNGQTHDIGEYAGADNLRGLCTALNEGGSIYLPMRAVTNAFGGRLEWNPDTATVTISK
jgi:hypothetical protein